MIIKNLFLFFAISFGVGTLGFKKASALTAGEVVRSSLEHHPLIFERLAENKIRESQLLLSQSPLDFQLKAEYEERLSGYYDGQRAGVYLEKSILPLNTKFKIGGRKSRGNFPVYDIQSQTLSDGELVAGIEASLLQGGLINTNKLNIYMAKESLVQADLALKKQRIQVQTEALKAFWNWFVLGHQTKTHQELLDLALNRKSQLQKRIRAGDLARIYGVENEQYLVKRKVQLYKSQNNFRKAVEYLSLFYRDKQGLPKKAGLRDLKNLSPTAVQSPKRFFSKLANVASINPDLKIMESKIRQNKKEVSFSKNLYLPQLDLKYEWSKDYGQGSSNLVGAENKVFLNFKLPLEFSKARGKYNLSQQKKSQSQIKLSFLKEKLKVQINRLKNDALNSYDVFKLTEEQIVLSQKLAAAERRKFRSGASDLILVNIREQNYAEAKIQHLEALYKTQSHQAEIKELLLQFDAPIQSSKN